MGQKSDHFPLLNIQEFSTHSDQTRDLLFHELRGKNYIAKPHKHDFFIIILFETGKGEHAIDFKSYEIKDQQVHLVFPNQVHQWDIKEGTIGYQLMISRKWFEIFWSSLQYSTSYYQSHPVLEVPETIFEALLLEFKSIQAELKETNNVFWELVQARSKVIGLLVSKVIDANYRDVEKFHSNAVIANFLKLVEEHFKQQRSVSFYADQLHISANYLNVVCQKGLNTTASSLIKDRILLEAKRLLKVSEMSVKDIVYDLNFYDHASFTKFFKALTEMTPSEFREDH